AVSNTDGKHQCKWRGKKLLGLMDILDYVIY
ncbi:hypothetical protein EVA_16258, partial [gut metagenome]